MTRGLIRVVLGAVAFCGITAAPAAAQICAGSPSFGSGPVQVNLGGDFGSNAQQFGGGIAFGTRSESGPIGSLSVGVLNVSDLNSTATSFSGGFGYEIPAGAAKRVFVCPNIGVGYSSGPDIGDINVSMLQVTGGGQVGVVATQTSNVAVVPTFGVSVARGRVNLEFLGEEETASDTFGIANMGVGLIFNGNMALTPVVAIPFSLEGGDPSFRIAFSVNFGR
jgi:hypothetical protein